MGKVVRRWGPVRALSALLFCLAGLGAGGAGARDLVVADRDANAVSFFSRGAVQGLDLATPPAGALEVIAAADAGDPLERIVEVAVSPVTDEIFVIDLGVSRTPRIVTLCSGSVTTLAQDPRFVAPINAEVTATGVLLVADREADPAGLGPDSLGGAGHGALFAVDAATGAVTVVSDGTLHGPLPGVVSGSAFEDPLGVAVDPVSGACYVADASADPLGTGATGAVYRVDLATGFVTLVSSTFGYVYPLSVAVLPDGTPLVLDAGFGANDETVFRIDLASPNPATNTSVVSRSAAMAQCADFAVTAAGRVFVADSGIVDVPTGTVLVPPAIFEIDLVNPDPATNAVLVHQSPDQVNPLSIAGRPGCIVQPRLAINRGSLRTMPEMLTQVAPACRQAPFVLCPEQIVIGPLAGMVLAGEAAPAGFESVWMYQHSDATTTMRVRRAGADLVFTP